MRLIALGYVAVRASQTEIRACRLSTNRSRYYVINMECLSDENLRSVTILTPTSRTLFHVNGQCGTYTRTHRWVFSGLMLALWVD